MNKKQKLVIIGIVVSALLVVGLAATSWYIVTQNNKNSEDSSTTSQPNSASTVTIRLTNKSTGAPIKNTNVKIVANNSIRCVKAPCPSDEKTWNGKTNKNGELRLDNSNLHRTNTVEVAGYTSTSLKYSDTNSTYSIELSPK